MMNDNKVSDVYQQTTTILFFLLKLKGCILRPRILIVRGRRGKVWGSSNGRKVCRAAAVGKAALFLVLGLLPALIYFCSTKSREILKKC